MLSVSVLNDSTSGCCGGGDTGSGGGEESSFGFSVEEMFLGAAAVFCFSKSTSSCARAEVIYKLLLLSVFISVFIFGIGLLILTDPFVDFDRSIN